MRTGRGIESSLQSRIAGIEKDRDDATKREADLRRKARDAAFKGKEDRSRNRK